MSEPNRSAIMAMCWKTSGKSRVLSWLKFGWWSWKYASLISFTRLESWLDGFCQHLVQGHYLSPLQGRGPVGVAWDMAPLRGKVSIGSGEWHHHLGQGEWSGTGGEDVPGAGPGGRGGAPWGMPKKWAIGACPSKTWNLPVHHGILEDWPSRQPGRWTGNWVEHFSPLQ